MLNRLREETRELHSRIETNPLHRAIVDGTVTGESYRLLLEKMHGVHQTFELCASVRPEWSQFEFDFEERRKIPLLDRDLAALGAGPALPRLPAAPLPLVGASFPYLLGYLYVLEGSTLGGQILSRLLAQHLGLTPACGAAYFTAYGAQAGARWKACQELLTRAAADPGSEDALVEGARDAFVQIDGWLREPVVH